VDKIEQIFSALLFSNPVCAFKFTSEWQTIELGLRSPARVHPIRIDRDVSVFDLGSVVHNIVKRRGKGLGKNFVEKILEQRAAHFAGHPPSIKPSQLLGDVTLETVATEIAGSGETSNARKKVYRGLTCLANVCVGDIGDIIKLYEEILKASDQKALPIPAEVQSQCFQDISALRLYDLNRRRVGLMRSAKAFAEASYELLVRSAKEVARGKESRLRQYSTVYVRVASEVPSDRDETQRLDEKQVEQLRDLIDAGVFVFSGGNPRTKTKDSNPVQQFKLSYRKIYGLANFIGLSDRDRFELSGADLQEWLSNPDTAKEILLRNQKGEIDDEGEGDNEGIAIEDEANVRSEPFGTAKTAGWAQGQLKFEVTQPEEEAKEETLPGLPVKIEVMSISEEALTGRSFDTVLVGIGFEERTLASNQALARLTVPLKVIAVVYPNPGQRNGILRAWVDKGRAIEEVAYADCIYGVPDLGAESLIDVSGLAKPAIFHAVRKQLTKYGRVVICHGAAETYYPLQSDLEPLFSAESGRNKPEMLAELAKVLKGEDGPYEPRRLLSEGGDALRKRVLLGYISPKHERIFELLQMREYDGIELVCGEGDDPRSKVARLAGEVLIRNYPNARLMPISSNDLTRLVEHADDTYRALYGTAGASFEVALTGSKLQAVASAVVSAKRKVAQAWYVSPKNFDSTRFSKGAGEVHFYEIRLS